MVDSNSLKVVKYIIRQTPIGHLSENIENLKNICEEELMDSSEIKSEIISYEEDHFKQFPTSYGKILISKQSKDGDNYYYDQSQRMKIKVNPLSEGVSLTELIEYNSPLQKALDTYLKVYKEKYFKDAITATNVIEQALNKLVIVISSHNINKKNFWSGEWLSSWELMKEQSSFALKGTVIANTFYYEEGNIQFHLETSFNESIAFGDENAIGKNVIDTIEEKENKVQLELDQVYDNFSDNYIKPLRRKIPVTGTKMNWNLNQTQFNKSAL